MATLVAFIHSLEATAQDDVFDVLGILLRDLFTKAEQADRKVRLRTLKDLDQAASTLADACRMLLDPNVPDQEVRRLIFTAIGEEKLVQASIDVSTLVRPRDDVFYGELTAKYATVKRFLPTLLRVIRFDGNASARPLLDALKWLRERPNDDPPTGIVRKLGSATSSERMAGPICVRSPSAPSMRCELPSGGAMSSSSRAGGMPIRKPDS